MAKDDYYVIVYQILSYLYQCLKKGATVDVSMLSSESLFGINKKYRVYIIRHMVEDDIVEGVVEKKIHQQGKLFHFGRDKNHAFRLRIR